MKQEAQAAYIRKDPKLPSDTTVQSVSNSVRFAERSQRKVLFKVNPCSKLLRITLQEAPKYDLIHYYIYHTIFTIPTLPYI